MSILLKNGHIFTAQRKYAENCPSRVDSSQPSPQPTRPENRFRHPNYNETTVPFPTWE